MGFARSPFRDFESILRIVVGLDEDDIQVIVKQYKSNFVLYELSPVTYTIKYTSEAVYTMGDHEGTLKTEYDVITMKTKLILARFAGNFENLRFDEGSFRNILLGFTPYWVDKPTNAVLAENPGVYTSEKLLNLSTIDKIHLKCDIINGSVFNGVRQAVLFSFLLDRPAGYNVFYESPTIHYKK